MLIYFGIIMGIIGAELALKQWVKSRKEMREIRGGVEQGDALARSTGKQENAAVGGTEKYFGCRIRLLENEGAAGGILKGKQDFLKKITGIWLGICSLWLWMDSRRKKISVTGLGLAMLLGGGIGNLADRMKKGSVTDYIQFTTFPIKPIQKLVFNISDFFIIIGGIFILFGENFKIKKGNSHTISENKN